MRALFSAAFVVLAFVIALPPSAQAARISMAECNEQVEQMRQNLPMDLDGMTTWTNTTCVDTGNGTIQLVYDNEVKDGNPITQDNLDQILESLVMSWCFGPDLIPLLHNIDSVRYLYTFANGTPIGELNFTEQNCDMRTLQ